LEEEAMEKVQQELEEGKDGRMRPYRRGGGGGSNRNGMNGIKTDWGR
jgi:hypothetical protein